MRQLKVTLLLFGLLGIPALSKAFIPIQSHFLSAENGLGSNYIRSIVQDANGYIWMGATNGLIRYDGYSAKLITPGEGPKRQLMTDSRVQSVDIWLDRFIWVRVRGRKYCCYDLHTDCFVDYTGDGSYQEEYKAYHILPNGELVLTDEKNGSKTIRFDGKQFHSQKSPKPLLQQRPSLHAGIPEECEWKTDNRGNTIAMTRQGEIWHIDAKNGKTTHLSGIYSDEMLRLNGSPRYGIVTDLDGMIWVSTYGNGLFIHNPKTGETTHILKTINNTAPIQTNYLLNIYEDRAGNIWTCQENMGVACLSKLKTKTDHYYFSAPEVTDHTNSIHLLSNVSGTVYIGNRYNGLKTANDHMGNIKAESGYGDDIVKVTTDQKGTLWLGTRNSGIYAGGRSYSHIPGQAETLTKGKISDIVCDHKGRMWISIFDGGVDLAVPDGKGGFTFQHFFQQGDAITHPRQMVVDHAGHIWLGSDDGLYTFQPEELLTDSKRYKRVDLGNHTTNEIHCIYETRSHLILAGTAGSGMVMIDNSKTGKGVIKKMINTEDGLSDNNVQQLIEDDMGYVWMGTDHGLVRYNTANQALMTLMPADIQLGNMFIENAVCPLADHKIAFGTRHGIVVVDTKDITPYKPIFKLLITNLYVNGMDIHDIGDELLANSIEQGREITLSHNQNSLTFHFSNFEYDQEQHSRYCYRLKGYDKDWSASTTYNQTSYKNLPPGDYTMEVKVQNNNGEWSEEMACMHLVINPPLWRTWWAYLLYLCIIVAVGWIALRYFKRINDLRNRIKVEEQLTAYKMQFFTNISHEFRTPLTIIRGAMERMQAVTSLPGEMKQPVSSMQKSVDRLMRMINQLLEFSRMHENKLKLVVEETDVVAFMRNIFDTFREMAENKSVNYQFSTFALSHKMLIDRSFLDKIAYNLISNAFKYSPNNSEISVKINKKEDWLTIVVEDTGIGISPEKQRELFTRFNQSSFAKDSIGIGLHLTQELVRVHHGSINYVERPGGGSIFTVALPCNAAVYADDEKVSNNSVLQEEQTNDQRPVMNTYKEMSADPINDLTVLIVEDDYDVRELLQNELRRFFVTKTASNGEEALASIREERPSLIISDVMMPVMNGFELTRHIRSEKEWADIPIIMLTALDGEDKQVKGLDTGADAYIIKPFSMNVLTARCMQLLEQRNLLKTNYAKEVVNVAEAPVIIVSEQDKKLRAQLDIWLASHLSESSLNINDFAQKMGYGRTTFYKKIKKLTGKTPNDYIKSMRMDKALQLLEDDTQTIASISYEVGIDDPFYFSKVFKQYFGISPSQYRKGEKPKQT